MLKKEIDIFPEILKAIENGYVCFNWCNYDDPDNFYVRQPHKILEMLTEKKWEVIKESADYIMKENEYAVEFWSRDGKSGHFARTYKGYNSLQSSVNVNQGKIISYRIFREVK